LPANQPHTGGLKPEGDEDWKIKLFSKIPRGTRLTAERMDGLKIGRVPKALERGATRLIKYTLFIVMLLCNLFFYFVLEFGGVLRNLVEVTNRLRKFRVTANRKSGCLKNVPWQTARFELLASDLPGSVVNRWLAWIRLFNFEIKHVAGKKHGGPDGLSRRKQSENDSDGDDSNKLDDCMDADLTHAMVNNGDGDAENDDMPDEMRRIKTLLVNARKTR